MKIKLTGIEKTLLIPLWARAVEGNNEIPIIYDNKAAEMVSSIDYDFAIFESARFSQLGVAVRTMLFDRAVERFLRKYPDAVIVNIGAGLDTRRERLGVDNTDWYELDVPESITLRRNFFTESLNYHFIEKSMFDESWMDDILDTGRQVLIIAEGVLMYFSEEQLKPLFSSIVQRFPDAQMLFEMLCPIMVKLKGRGHDSINKVGGGIEFKWGLKDAHAMEHWHAGIKFVDEWNIFDYSKNRWGMFGWIARLPLLRTFMAHRIVQLQFNNFVDN